MDEARRPIEEERTVPPAGDYTPSLACNGARTAVPGQSDNFSFEVRILNNGRRPTTHEIFQQQYRPDASVPMDYGAQNAPWIALRIAPRSGFTTPLFSSASSPPFRWRARSWMSTRDQQSDDVCYASGQNIINWIGRKLCIQREWAVGPPFT